MGIDARILLRVKGPRPSAEQLKLWSWNLCASIGAHHFWIDAEKGWPAITYTEGRFPEEGVKPGTVYFQDGDDIVAEAGETLLDVHVWSRYYGVGYERGDLLTLCAIAEWCEANIPGVSVWYGGDSSGMCAEPWPAEKRAKLRRHLYTEEGRSYAFAACEHEQRNGLPSCALCVPDRGMTQCGFGGHGQFEAWHCKGCGKEFETRDGRQTWALREEA